MQVNIIIIIITIIIITITIIDNCNDVPSVSISSTLQLAQLVIDMHQCAFNCLQFIYMPHTRTHTHT